MVVFVYYLSSSNFLRIIYMKLSFLFYKSSAFKAVWALKHQASRQTLTFDLCSVSSSVQGKLAMQRGWCWSSTWSRAASWPPSPRVWPWPRPLASPSRPSWTSCARARWPAPSWTRNAKASLLSKAHVQEVFFCAISTPCWRQAKVLKQGNEVRKPPFCILTTVSVSFFQTFCRATLSQTTIWNIFRRTWG